MAPDFKNIEKIYKTYGFDVKLEEAGIHTFLYKKGRYFGIDIFCEIDNAETCSKIKNLQKEYSKQGYAVNIKAEYTTYSVEEELFRSFFSYDIAIRRLNKKYSDFVEKQTKHLLGNQYTYINSPYDLYDGEEEFSNMHMLDVVKNVFDRPSPQLLIIEAAAGYGKTCAAYEILKNLINSVEELSIPLFTELSKNRGAKIFRYVLLDEIDLEFPALNSELVIHEIRNGRIPLIIDGFDELLEKVNISNVNTPSAFSEIETMLDTIGKLLTRNAKVILTTRKTAVFSGIEFDKWYNKWDNSFEVTRFSLNEPKIKDWLGKERFKQVEEKDIPIQYIANPVILTYLRNIEDEEFIDQIEHSELLIKQYFNRMLEREKERQNLIITVDKQYEIFKNVARMLISFDIMVESKEFFKEVIKDQNTKLLEYTRSLYTGNEKPSLDNLVDTLATHALLDRKGRDESLIGFVNDFVLGILVGEIICETDSSIIDREFSYYMLDLACTAYKVQNKANKSNLWNKVESVKHKLQPLSIFNYDIILKEALMRNYSDLSIYDTTFYKIDFDGFSISKIAFLNCIFKQCAFNTESLKGISFIDCKFEKCEVTNEDYLDSSNEVSIVKCKPIDCHIIEHYKYHEESSLSDFNKLQTEVLSKIFDISGTKSQHIMQLLHGYEKGMHKKVLQTLDQIEKQGYVNIRGSHINFNINKLDFIKTHLGK